MVEHLRRLLRFLFELRAPVGVGAVATSADNQRARAFWIAHPEVQRRKSAHRDADDMRLVDPEPVEHGADIVAGARLGVLRDVLGNVGGRVAARVVGDASVASAEVADLRLVTAMVAGKLVDEDDRHPLAGLLVVELHAVVGGDVRHWRSPGSLADAKLSYRS